MQSSDVKRDDRIASRPRLLAGVLASPVLVAAALLSACSVVPDWSERESAEMNVTVHYDRRPAPREVAMPASNEHLLVLSLRSDPNDLEQRFTKATRHLRLPADRGDIKVHCRYRLFRRLGVDGELLPWPTPTDLFPGARHIVRRGDGDGSIEQKPQPETQSQSKPEG